MNAPQHRRIISVFSSFFLPRRMFTKCHLNIESSVSCSETVNRLSQNYCSHPPRFILRGRFINNARRLSFFVLFFEFCLFLIPRFVFEQRAGGNLLKMTGVTANMRQLVAWERKYAHARFGTARPLRRCGKMREAGWTGYQFFIGWKKIFIHPWNKEKRERIRSTFAARR